MPTTSIWPDALDSPSTLPPRVDNRDYNLADDINESREFMRKSERIIGEMAHGGGVTNFYCTTPDTPDLWVKIAGGVAWFSDSTLVRKQAGPYTSPPVTPPVSNPRIDLLTLDLAGNFSWTVGAESATPVPPSYPPGEYPICEIYCRPGMDTILSRPEDDDLINGYIRYPIAPFASVPSVTIGTSGHTIFDEATPLPDEPGLRFVGPFVNVADNPIDGSSDVTISVDLADVTGDLSDITGQLPDTRVDSSIINDGVTQPSSDAAVTLDARINQLSKMLRVVVGSINWYDSPDATLNNTWAKFHDTTGHNHTGSGNNGPQLTNASIAVGAAIDYAKLNLANSIVSGDIVNGTIVDADINAAAGIAYAKLNLANSIVGSDIVNGTLFDIDINAAAAITVTKLAAGAVSTVLQTDAGGSITWAAVTAAMITSVPASKVTTGTFNGGDYIFPANVGIGGVTPSDVLDVRIGATGNAYGLTVSSPNHSGAGSQPALAFRRYNAGVISTVAKIYSGAGVGTSDLMFMVAVPASPTVAVSVMGLSSPSNVKLNLGSRPDSNTNLYNNYNTQAWPAFEIRSGSNIPAGISLGATGGAGTTTSLGVISFFNVSAGTEGTNDLRTGMIGSTLAGAVNTATLDLYTASAGTLGLAMQLGALGRASLGGAISSNVGLYLRPAQSIVAASNGTYALLVQTTMTTSANGDSLTALYVQPTVSNAGAFTGTDYRGINVTSINATGFAASYGLIVTASTGATTNYAALFGTGGTGRLYMGRYTLSDSYFAISFWSGTLDNNGYNITSSPSDPNLYLNAPTGNGIRLGINNVHKIFVDAGGVGIGAAHSTGVGFEVFDPGGVGYANVRVSSASARFSHYHTTGAADQRKWQNYVSTNVLNFTALNDAENGETNWLAVNRGTGTAITSVVVTAGAIPFVHTAAGFGIRRASTGYDIDIYNSSTSSAIAVNLENNGTAAPGSNYSYINFMNPGTYSMYIGRECGNGSGLVAGASGYDGVINVIAGYNLRIAAGNAIRMTVNPAYITNHTQEFRIDYTSGSYISFWASGTRNGFVQHAGSVMWVYNEVANSTLDLYTAGASSRVQFYTNGLKRVWIGGGIVVGNVIDNGPGTVNVETGIYKAGTGYTNPDYALEHYYTGKIEKYKDNKGASDYAGLMPLSDLDNYMRENWRLPRIKNEPTCVFDMADIALEKIEELTLYILQLNKRIERLESQYAR